MRLRRFRVLALSCSLLLGLSLLSVFFFAGCSRPAPDDEDGNVVRPAKAVPMTPMESSGKASLTGKVTLTGNMPDLAALDRETEAMIKGNAGGKGCNAYQQQKWLLGKDYGPAGKGLGNVVVMLRPEKNKFFAVPVDADVAKDWKASPDGTLKPEITIDQPGCAFTDHVVVVFPQYPDPKDPKNFKAAIRTGQKLVVLNEEGGVSHSFHFEGNAKNAVVDRSSQPKTRLPIEVFPDSSPLTATCGVHPWMSCSIWVVDNPYYAITDKDGNYTMKNVPAGKCRIVFWHEVLGYQSTDGFKGEPIDLKKDENVKDFTFNRK
jgi:hypothetical protein